VFLAVSGAQAQEESYGFNLGTVLMGATGSISYSSALEDIGLGSVHPTVGGGVSVGLHKYFGLFAHGGDTPVASASAKSCVYGVCANARASANIIHVVGGFEVIGTNRSRFVPFGRVGFGYGRGAVSGSVSTAYGGVSATVSQGTPDVAFGGGLRTYLTRHFGISAGWDAYRTVGNNGGNTFFMPVGGVFAQFN